MRLASATPEVILLNRCQSMSTTKKLNDKQTVKCEPGLEASGIVTLRRHVERRSPGTAAFGERFPALWIDTWRFLSG